MIVGISISGALTGLVGRHQQVFRCWRKLSPDERLQLSISETQDPGQSSDVQPAIAVVPPHAFVTVSPHAPSTMSTRLAHWWPENGVTDFTSDDDWHLRNLFPLAWMQHVPATSGLVVSHVLQFVGRPVQNTANAPPGRELRRHSKITAITGILGRRCMFRMIVSFLQVKKQRYGVLRRK